MVLPFRYFCVAKSVLGPSVHPIANVTAEMVYLKLQSIVASVAVYAPRGRRLRELEMGQRFLSFLITDVLTT